MGKLNQDAVLGDGMGVPKNDVLDGTQIPHGKGSFWGRNGVVQCNV